MRDYKSTILVDKETRSMLSKIGRKNQSYDQIIRELIETKNRISLLEIEAGNFSSSELNH
jgi:predicted CopG family antitoxin